jgi:hypothetical protein
MADRRDDEVRDFVKEDHNEDPLSGEHGAHPVGTGAGTAIGGAAAGAAGGALGGPVGAVVGAVVGGVAGGLAGKAIAESIDPTIEYGYWEAEYENRPYYDKDVDYDTYAPAYRHGWEGRARHADRTYDEAEADLRREWEESEFKDKLDWEKARPATRDAWHRIDENYTSYSSDTTNPKPPKKG